MEVKAWLEGAGEPVIETCFPPGDAPGLPYLVFLDRVTRGGADLKNLYFLHSLTVERYAADTGDNAALEALFDEKSLEYTKDKMWLSSEDCYMTIYDIETNLVERKD